MPSINTNDLSKALREIVWQFGPRGLDGQCYGDLSMPEFIALEKAADTENCSIQQVGRKLGFTKSGATRIVNRLETKGYIEKVTSAEDGRICCVVLTKNGRSILTDASRRYAARLKAVLGQMSDDTAAAVSASLSELAKTLSG